MLLYSTSSIYGIDVYTFTSSYGFPFQLTVEPHLQYDKYNISLINLMGRSKHLFDKEIKKVICDILYKHLKITSRILYFEIDITKKSEMIKLVKFYRWSTKFTDINFDVEIIKTARTKYAEVTIQPK